MKKNRAITYEENLRYALDKLADVNEIVDWLSGWDLEFLEQEVEFLADLFLSDKKRKQAASVE